MVTSGSSVVATATRLRAVARFADDHHVGFALEHHAQRLSDGGVVVDQEDARVSHRAPSPAGTLTCTSVPAPGRLRTSKRPPHPSTRSRM